MAQPISLCVLLGVIGGLLVACHRVRIGLVVSGGGVLVLVLGAYTSLGFVMIAPLENRIGRPATMPEAVTTLIMLGGATVGRVSAARGISELNDAGDRVVETLRLAQHYPAAKVVLSGGSGNLEGDVEPEAVIVGRLLLAMGIAPERLVLEATSRNTAENADLTKQLLGSIEGSVILVTSAFHMPRSVELFQQAGLTVVPWPIDYRSAGNEGFGIDMINPALNLTTTGVAMREWIGLLVYAGTGRIADLFPAQAPG
ncbi:MAG: YdcF family protein [Candidatus Devosia euplotis]|nr:YdcF family protein [Candidatus Devosia euplotis]